MRTAIGTMLALLAALMTNYAAQFGPAWTRNPWVVWSVLGILSALMTAAAVAPRRSRLSRRPARAALLDSLRPPAMDVPVRGRKDELARLTELVRRPNARFAVICGAGGTGKTTLAAELAARTRVAVYWVRWRDPDSFAEQLREIADTLGGPGDVSRNAPDRVWSVLAARRKWLLVVDNADRPRELCPNGDPLAEYRGWVRPSGSGLLLVTSRDTDPHTWGAAAELITLDPLPIADAATVLLDTAPRAGTLQQAHLLAARLGGFPLALRAAGRAIAAPTARHRTFDAFRVALDLDLADILATPLTPDQEKRTLLRYTWELSLDQLIDEGHPVARQLLRTLSLAADALLPLDLITPALFKNKVTRLAIDGALAGLRRYGLVGIRDGAIPCLTMHPLVREINAMLLAEGCAVATRQRLLDRVLLDDAARAAAAGPAGHARINLLAPHLAAIPTHRANTPSAARAACRTLIAAAESLDPVGNAHSRALLWSAVHDGALATVGPDHPATLSSRNNHANALRELGDFIRAAELHRLGVADHERLFGPDHPRTLASRTGLATDLHKMGHLTRSAELHEQTLADCIRVLGPDDPQTLTCRHNFANLLRELNRLDEYAAQHEHVLAARNRVLGPDHLDTFASRTTVAETQRTLGDPQRAKELCEQTLTDCRRVLGPDHPYTLHIRTNLAVAMMDLGELHDAAKLQAHILADYEQLLGHDHPDTRHARANLTAVQRKLKKRHRPWRHPRPTPTDSP